MGRLSAFIIAICLLWGSGAHGRTITVARDGSGEYTILQHALNATASGDTILIGPGEYTEMFSVKYPGYAWNVDVVGDIKVSELTIIGAGSDQTFIGQAVQNIDYDHNSPIALCWRGGVGFRIEDVTLRNSFDGLDAADGPVFVDNCEFVENVRGLIWYDIGLGGWVKHSSFRTTFVSSNAQLDVFGTGGGALIENCDIGSSPHDISLQVSMVEDIIVRNCEMHGGRTGVQVTAGASCLFDNCRMYDCEYYGFSMGPVGPRCEIRDSEISGGLGAVWVDVGGVLNATQTIFSGGTAGVFMLSNTGPTFIRYCHIFRGSSEYSVECLQIPDQGGVRHDFRGNYWGTGDSGLISSWILDGHDDSNILAEVLFEPFYGGPVENETTSWGNLKALWR